VLWRRGYVSVMEPIVIAVQTGDVNEATPRALGERGLFCSSGLFRVHLHLASTYRTSVGKLTRALQRSAERRRGSRKESGVTPGPRGPKLHLPPRLSKLVPRWSINRGGVGGGGERDERLALSPTTSREAVGDHKNKSSGSLPRLQEGEGDDRDGRTLPPIPSPTTPHLGPKDFNAGKV
jgi:hypothetical protein